MTYVRKTGFIYKKNTVPPSADHPQPVDLAIDAATGALLYPDLKELVVLLHVAQQVHNGVRAEGIQLKIRGRNMYNYNLDEEKIECALGNKKFCFFGRARKSIMRCFYF